MSKDPIHPLSIEDVCELCSRPEFVEHYRQSIKEVGGLWESERILVTQLFSREAKLLDLGCGVGRVSFGLREEGYSNVEGMDFSPAMIDAAKTSARERGIDTPFAVGDATNLSLPDADFDGVIFGFGGLMQIPGRPLRRKALREIQRILKPGGWFLFTTHDREMEEVSEFWETAIREGPGEFGDICEEGPHGLVFVHVPDIDEVDSDLRETGWSDIRSFLRSDIAEESDAVEESADNCRFWLARKE
ncbi:MAG: class I SAM-dependent methyltransferase [Opitutales bacterium]